MPDIVIPDATKIASTLSDAITKIENTHDITDYLAALSQEINHIIDTFCELGDECTMLLQEETTLPAELKYQCYIVSYDFGNEAKNYAMLWRNILFETIKGYILNYNDRLSSEKLAIHRVEAEEVLKVATEETSNYIQNRFKAFMANERLAKKSIAGWKLQTNPWSIYKQHLETINSQCQELYQGLSELKTFSDDFKLLKKLINSSVEVSSDDLKLIQQHLANLIQTIADVEQEVDTKSLTRLSISVDEIERSLKKHAYHINFSSSYEALLANLPDKKTISVQIVDGMIANRELNLQKKMKQWMESEVMPLLYEIWEVAETNMNSMKMALVNVRNRIILVKSQLKEKKGTIGTETLATPLLGLKDTVAASVKEYNELASILQKRVDRELQVSQLLENSQLPFLPVRTQSTLQQFKLSNRVVLQYKKIRQQIVGFVNKLILRVEREEALSTSEKIVRFIKNREGDTANSYYANIFLTKGYVGETFWVGREEKVQRVETLINDWKLGFRGSVLITGNRLSGKSLFGEYIARQYFPNKIIRLKPNQELRINGRKKEVGYDLEEALQFVKENTINQQSLIWLDDLELWWDVNQPLMKNVRALKRFIDSYSHKLFIMVSMSQWLKAQIEEYYAINKLFQAEIKTSRMSKDEIEEAIMIRHGATHKVLVDDKGEPLSSQKFEQITKKIHSAAEGNIGEALNLWAFSTYKVDENRVRNTFQNSVSLPDFLNAETGAILSTIFLQKRTNEYRLRKQFGPTFSEKYAGLVKRLLGVGILERQLDDWLEVNDCVVNKVGSLLENKYFLKK